MDGGITVVGVIAGIILAFVFYGVYKGTVSKATQQARPWYVPIVWILTIIVLAIIVYIFKIALTSSSTNTTGLSSSFTSKLTAAFALVLHKASELVKNPTFQMILLVIALMVAVVYIVNPSTFYSSFAPVIWNGPFPIATHAYVASDHEIPRSLSSYESTYSFFAYVETDSGLADPSAPISLVKRAGMWDISVLPTKGQILLTVNYPHDTGLSPSQIIVNGFPVQKYTFISLVIRGTDVKLYVNGTLVGGQTINVLPAYINSPLTVGQSLMRNSGSVRLIGYWPQALTPDEIAKAYNTALITLGTPSPSPYDSGDSVLQNFRKFKTKVCIGDLCSY